MYLAKGILPVTLTDSQMERGRDNKHNSRNILSTPPHWKKREAEQLSNLYSFYQPDNFAIGNNKLKTRIRWWTKLHFASTQLRLTRMPILSARNLEL